VTMTGWLRDGGLQWVTVTGLLLRLTGIPVCQSACGHASLSRSLSLSLSLSLSVRTCARVCVCVGGGQVHAHLTFSEHIHQSVI